MEILIIEYFVFTIPNYDLPPSDSVFLLPWINASAIEQWNAPSGDSSNDFGYETAHTFVKTIRHHLSAALISTTSLFIHLTRVARKRILMSNYFNQDFI